MDTTAMDSYVEKLEKEKGLEYTKVVMLSVDMKVKLAGSQIPMQHPLVVTMIMVLSELCQAYKISDVEMLGDADAILHIWAHEAISQGAIK